jgi:hypothetical protein
LNDLLAFPYGWVILIVALWLVVPAVPVTLKGNVFGWPPPGVPSPLLPHATMPSMTNATPSSEIILRRLPVHISTSPKTEKANMIGLPNGGPLFCATVVASATVSVDVTVLLPGMTDAGEKLHVTPAGGFVHANATLAL